MSRVAHANGPGLPGGVLLLLYRDVALYGAVLLYGEVLRCCGVALVCEGGGALEEDGVVASSLTGSNLGAGLGCPADILRD